MCNTKQQNHQESLVHRLPVTGVGESLLCKHRLPPTKSGLIHHENSPALTNANVAFLWVENRATRVEGGGDSQLSGTQKQTTSGTQKTHMTAKPSVVKEKSPLHFFAGKGRQSGFENPGGWPPAQSVPSQHWF